jgi:hypothetical protein
MNALANELSTLVVAGSGEANSLRPELFEARTRATVRYADPAAWITAAAVALAIHEVREQLASSLHEVGMVVVSDQGPASTMAEVNAATSIGFSSPLRYAAASPGSLAGVSCIAFGFRGPTLNFTMPLHDGVPTALQMCSGWLTRHMARYMVLATYRASDLTTGFSRAVLLAQPEPSGEIVIPMTQAVSDWLTQNGD